MKISSLFILVWVACILGFSQVKNIPTGKIEIFQFKQSKIFPGTEREIALYIPQQLDPQKPACVYLQQDGYYPKSGITEALDTLIAEKKIPALVGIFIKPGNLPPLDKNTLPRPNRCFEYDAVDDSYARFILDEVIPYVKDHYKLNLSNSGNDRCFGGASSGGISAFNVAWLRPNDFSRVYCNSGSFVAFRGGHEYPTLVRKTEAKPIRAYLTTATHDMENCAGDWYLIDLEMDKALKFSGYDYKFSILEGYHVAGWKEHFSQAMQYLWKDWPAPVIAGPSAPRVQDIILPNETWKSVSSSFTDLRGPASNAKGEIFFCDKANNKIYRIDTNGSIIQFLSDAGHCNSLSFGANGELYTASDETGKIIKYDEAGKASIIAAGIRGNHILVAPGGGIYVSGTDQYNKEKVWYIKDKNKIIDSEIKHPTGITMSPDRWLLAIADGSSHWIYSYQVAEDGSLINKERFFWLHKQDWTDDAGTETICYDLEGHLYAATRYGIQVCAWDGPTQVILPMPNNERVTGICIGGPKHEILYAFCNGKIYKRKIKNHSLGAWSPWTKMTRGTL